MIRMMSHGAAAMGFSLGLRSVYRLSDYVKYVERSESKETKGLGVYWSLYSIGVDPDMRRRGYGSQLLQPVLRMADKAGTFQSLVIYLVSVYFYFYWMGFLVCLFFVPICSR
jgi:ribosomal protein S18 acetylase RimI-like enzyme